jgi:ubiquinone/menaquinone biosynthesis C-methylase UbiE
MKSREFAMHPIVEYDTIATTYDRRYLDNDYSGVENALVAFVGQNLNGRALEVGCGTGHWLRFLGAKGIPVAGLDASTRMLACAHAQDHRTALVRGLAEHLPWADESFDRLFCVNALHHFRDKQRFLVEALRVLRRGGQFMTIGLDPHTGLDQWHIYEYFEPVLEIDRRRYSPTGQIRERMNAVEFVDCVTREVQHLQVRLSARAAIEQGRLDRGATSQLALLTEDQYQQGIDRIRKGIESAEARDDSLYLTADLRLYATFASVPSKL